MKSKVLFITLIFLFFGILFCVESCKNDFLYERQTSININLDLSKILKETRNLAKQISSEFILRLVVYDAATYKTDSIIENLPVLAQVSNKVDTSGIVKTTVEVPIDANVIFEAKLFTINTETKEESQDPLYYGRTEVINIKETDTKVSIVLEKIQLNEFLVQFNTLGGSIVDDQKVEENKTATEPISPTKTGYTFDGWYTSSDEGTTLETEFDFTAPITSDITLYAKWIANKSGITITLPEANDPEINLQQTINEETMIFTANDGFESYAWYIDGEKQENVTGKTFEVDTSSMTAANYTVMVIVTDYAGYSYSATAFLELKK